MDTTQKHGGILSPRAKKLGAFGLTAVIASAGALGAFSLYSQSNSVTSNYGASTWGLELNEVPVNGTEATISLGDGLNLVPGEEAHTQARFKNTGSAALVVDLDSVTGTGDLAPYLEVAGVAVDATTAGTFAYGECVETVEEMIPGDPQSTWKPASTWNFPAWVTPDPNGMPLATEAECLSGYQIATLANAATFTDSGLLIVEPGQTVAVNFKVSLEETVTAETASGKTANAVAKFNFTQAPMYGDKPGIGGYKTEFGTFGIYGANTF